MLDCAAGTGLFSLAVSGRAGQVLCTDLSRPMLDQARKKAARRGLSNIVFARRDLLALPEGAVRKLWRVTAPGGILLLPTYLQGRAGAAYGTVIKIYRGMGFHCEHAFTPESCRAFLEGLNLAPVELEIIPGPLPLGLAVLRKPAP